jgi:hypothetical protein
MLTDEFKSFSWKARTALLFFGACATVALLLTITLTFADDDKPSGSAKDDYLQMDVWFEKYDGKQVGSYLKVKIVLTNLTAKRLAVASLWEGREREEKMLPIYCRLRYPDVVTIEPGKERETPKLSFAFSFPGSYGPIHREDFILFQPNEKKERIIMLRPKIPGEAYIYLQCASPTKTDNYIGERLPEGTEIWKGNLGAEAVKSERFKVLPPENRASSVGSLLFDERKSFLERMKLLEEEIVMGEEMVPKTVSGAMVLTKFLETLPKSSPLRFLVVQRMIIMVSEAYGYPAVEPLLRIAEDPSEQTNVRLYSLDVAKLIVAKETLFLGVDGNLAIVQVPSKWREMAKSVLKNCAESKDESVSNRAKYLLDELSKPQNQQKEENRK